MQTDKHLIEPLNEREREIIPLLAKDLSNREIANQLFLAPSTVKWYVRQLNQKLDTSNRQEIVERVAELGLFDVETAPQTYFRKRTNLPYQTTPFVGRDAELDELHTILENPDVRLLTILAPGGMGKTRIALEAAEQQANNFPDGVYFVALQPLAEPNNIIPQIATSTGYQFGSDGREAKQQVLDFLGNKQILLVMDNWEHLLEGAPLVNEILAAAPDVKILATSREKLNLMGETVYILQGMHFPTWETPEDALEYDAVQLLLQAAQRVKPDWEVTHENLDYVARVGRLTQGMPLGILLAASWLDVYTVERICEEIQKSADILETEMRDVPERQRSIRAVFEYAWQRLKPQEQAVLMQMSVFRGGCSPQAAEAVTGANARILHSLVNKALLTRNQDGRYDIHELLRQYAEAELEQSGETELAHSRHAEYYANAVNAIWLEIFGPRELEVMKVIEGDFANIKAAWDWAVEWNNYAVANRMLDTLDIFSEHTSRLDEFAPMLSRAIEQFSGSENPDQKRVVGRCLARYTLHAEQEKRLHMIQAALDIARESKDDQEITDCLIIRVAVLRQLGNYTEALDTLDKAAELYQRTHNQYHNYEVLRQKGVVLAAHLDQWDEAVQLWKRALEIAVKMGFKSGIAGIKRILGVHEVEARQYQNFDNAIRLASEALDIFRELGYVGRIFHTIWNMVRCLCYQGKYQEAERYAEEASAIAHDGNDWRRIVGALNILASIRFCQGLYIEQLELTEKALALGASSDSRHSFDTKINYGQALCGLKEFNTARQVFIETLREHLHSMQNNGLAVVLFGMSLVIAYDDEQPERALTVASVALKHHRVMTNCDIHPLAKDLREHLQRVLSPEVYDAAWKLGETLDIKVVVQELLDEFGDTI